MSKIRYADFLKEITLVKTADFTANDENGTVYIVTGSSADVEITLESSAVETRYTFINGSNTYSLEIIPPETDSIQYWNEAGSDVRSADGISGEYLQIQPAASVSIIKVSATLWAVVFGSGISVND